VQDNSKNKSGRINREEQIGVRPPIFAILNEDLATIIAARDYVIQTTLDLCAHFTGHGSPMLLRRTAAVNAPRVQGFCITC
jgi:hypothetical protein